MEKERRGKGIEGRKVRGNRKWKETIKGADSLLYVLG